MFKRSTCVRSLYTRVVHAHSIIQLLFIFARTAGGVSLYRDHKLYVYSARLLANAHNVYSLHGLVPLLNVLHILRPVQPHNGTPPSPFQSYVYNSFMIAAAAAPFQDRWRLELQYSARLAAFVRLVSFSLDPLRIRMFSWTRVVVLLALLKL